MKKISLFVLMGVALVHSSADACSKITNDLGKAGLYTARTMDFCAQLDSALSVYPRGRAGSGGVVGSGKALTWTSKYGFLGSAFYRKDGNFLGGGKVIAEGVNEKGLAVHLLFMQGAELPARDPDRPGVNVFMWPEYVLGSFSKVKDVIKDLGGYQIVGNTTKVHGKDFAWPVHFALEDAGGDMAIVEFIKGEVKVYHGRQYAVMANEPDLPTQLKNLAAVKKAGLYSNNVLPGGADSKNRFVRLSFYHDEAPRARSSEDAVSLMFSAVSGVYAPYFRDYQKRCDFAAITSSGEDINDAWPTITSTVVDHKGRVFYFNDMNVGNRVWVDLKKVDLSHGQPVRSVLPSEQGLVGDITAYLK